MIVQALRAAPRIALVALVTWTGWDVAHVTTARWDFLLQAFFVLAIVLFLVGQARWGGPIRRLAVFVLAVTYFAARFVDLGVDVVPALAFLTLLIVYVEVGALADRFVPIVDRSMDVETRRRVHAALARAVARLAVAAALAILVPILAADLALAGLVPATSVATALLFAAGLLAIVIVLALLPTIGREREA